MQDVAFKNANFFIFWKWKLCKDNPKAAPGIRPILLTQVHYHLHQQSYLHHRPQTQDCTHSHRHRPHNQHPDQAFTRTELVDDLIIHACTSAHIQTRTARYHLASFHVSSWFCNSFFSSIGNFLFLNGLAFARSLSRHSSKSQVSLDLDSLRTQKARPE